jgi:hypothetical protein
VLNRGMGDTEIPIEVGGQRIVLIAKDHYYPDLWKALELQRPGDAPQRIWYLDERPRHVSREEYERSFSQPQP